MKQEVLTSGDTDWTTYISKYSIDINSVDIDKIMISNRISFGKKVQYMDAVMMGMLSHTQCFQNWVEMHNFLMKQNTCFLFLKKMMNC